MRSVYIERSERPGFFCCIADVSQIEPADYGLADESRPMAVLNRIHTQAAVRRTGLARTVMQRLLADADADGMVLVLELNPYGGMTKKQLIAWYRRCGFVEIGLGMMRREPVALDKRANALVQ